MLTKALNILRKRSIPLYRVHSGLLWKADYARLYTENFPDPELVSEQELSYLESDNVDSVFLLHGK